MNIVDNANSTVLNLNTKYIKEQHNWWWYAVKWPEMLSH